MMERKLIVGNKGGKDRPDFICFGFFGGIFESAQGLRVMVLDADLDSSPETVTYCANFTDGENEVEQSMGLSQFLADCPPLEVEDQVEWETEGAEQGDDEIVIDMSVTKASTHTNREPMVRDTHRTESNTPNAQAPL